MTEASDDHEGTRPFPRPFGELLSDYREQRLHVTREEFAKLTDQAAAALREAGRSTGETGLGESTIYDLETVRTRSRRRQATFRVIFEVLKAKLELTPVEQEELTASWNAQHRSLRTPDQKEQDAEKRFRRQLARLHPDGTVVDRYTLSRVVARARTRGYRIVQLETQLVTLSEERDAQRAALTEQVARLTSDKEALLRRTEQDAEELQRTRGRLATATAQAVDLTHRNRELAGRVQALEANLDVANTDLATLDAHARTLQAQLSSEQAEQQTWVAKEQAYQAQLQAAQHQAQQQQAQQHTPSWQSPSGGPPNGGPSARSAGGGTATSQSVFGTSTRRRSNLPLTRVGAALLLLAAAVGIVFWTVVSHLTAGAPPIRVYAPTATAGAVARPTTRTTSAPAGAGTYPYETSAPGAGCDTGAGQWASAPQTVIQCTAQGTMLSGLDRSATFSQIVFHGVGGVAVPAAYRVDTRVGHFRGGTCAGLMYQLTDDPNAWHYGMAVCLNGSWTDDAYNMSGTRRTRLYHGTVPAASSYLVSVTYAYGHQIIVINGQTVADFTNGLAPQGSFVSLGADNAGGNVQAVFSDFTMRGL